MNNSTTIDTTLYRRIDITMGRDGSGHISLTNTLHGDFVQARLTKREVDKLCAALKAETVSVSTPEPVFLVGDRLVVTGTAGHSFDIGDIVKIEYTHSDDLYRACRIHDDYSQDISAKDLKKVSATTPKFTVGDTVVVTGDSNHTYPHKLPVGTKVRIVEHRDMDGDYWVEHDDTGYSAYLFEGDMKAVPKFSEGDKVRVIGNTGIHHHYRIGDIVTVCEDGYGDVIECMKIRPNGLSLYQGVSVEDLERFTGPELVEGDVYLDEDLDTWTVRDGKLAFHHDTGREPWDWIEAEYGPLKKVAGWQVVLPNGEKVEVRFPTKEDAERLAESRTQTLKELGATVTNPARVEAVTV